MAKQSSNIESARSNRPVLAAVNMSTRLMTASRERPFSRLRRSGAADYAS
jgi:hypothetical protein